MAEFITGTSVDFQKVAPLIGTTCRIILLRCDEKTNAIGKINEVIGAPEESGTGARKDKNATRQVDI